MKHLLTLLNIFSGKLIINETSEICNSQPVFYVQKIYLKLNRLLFYEFTV